MGGDVGVGGRGGDRSRWKCKSLYLNLSTILKFSHLSTSLLYSWTLGFENEVVYGDHPAGHRENCSSDRKISWIEVKCLLLRPSVRRLYEPILCEIAPLTAHDDAPSGRLIRQTCCWSLWSRCCHSKAAAHLFRERLILWKTYFSHGLIFINHVSFLTSSSRDFYGCISWTGAAWSDGRWNLKVTESLPISTDAFGSRPSLLSAWSWSPSGPGGPAIDRCLVGSDWTWVDNFLCCIRVHYWPRSPESERHPQNK